MRSVAVLRCGNRRGPHPRRFYTRPARTVGHARDGRDELPGTFAPQCRLAVQLSTQANGRHERLHRTLKQETAQPPATNRRSQQRALDRFRQEYNELRPHEALQMRTPAAVYAPSARKFPARVPEPEYPASMLVRSVRPHGHFRWKKEDVFLSEVLWGEPVGLLADDERWYTIYFAQLPIARFDSQQLCVRPLPKSSGFCKVSAGERVASLPLHPIPSLQRSKKCQGCARSKVSGMPPAAQNAFDLN
jgi:hypothetical protein